jgi:rubrerythrin
MYTASYSADEIFEMAEQIERNGAAFYRKAASFVNDAPSRDFLLRLAEQEDDHERTFAAIRAEVVADSGKIARYDQDETVAGYLRALAGQYVFRKDREPPSLLTGGENVGEVLRMAIGQEKDSIVLYLGLMDALADSGDAERIRRIIREEQRHLAELLKKLADGK